MADDARTRRLRELPRYSQSSLDDMLMRDPDGDWVRFSDVEAVLDTEGDRPAQKTWCQTCGTACAVYCDACHEILFHADTEGDTSPAPNPQDRVTRLEVIGPKGRIFSKWDCGIQLSYQDGGRTLKVFVDWQALPNPPVQP
jgi:hypothetical protein